MNGVVSTYVHALEGRLRIKLPEIKRAALKAREVERHLHGLAGVESVSANPTTGNVLILYNPQAIEQEELFFFLMQWGYLSPSREGSGRADSPSALERTAASVAATIMEVAFTQLIGALI
ncbi:MAG: HMA2 domain-containing protein [Desulfobaccales bacterium]